MTKVYDRAYFQRWYHHRGTRINSHADVRRKAALALTTAEYFLHRPVRSVLDVGCGEGAWRAHLRALRPSIKYLGLDSSEYAIQRFGRARNIRRAAFGDLPTLDLGVFDLVICSDVLHYVPNDEILAGTRAIAKLCDGVAFFEVLTAEDDVIGDLDAFIERSAKWYRAVFAKAGFTQVGPYSWASPSLRNVLAELEQP